MPDLEERVAALEAAAALTAGPDEPGFMAHVTVETLVRLTHHPTRITVEARDRRDGVSRLGRALAARDRRERELEEVQHRAERRAAKG
jgi:protein subunit release factor A